MNTRNRILGGAGVLALIAFTPNVSADTFWVAPHGDDDNSGTIWIQPFATIRAAVQAALYTPGSDSIQVLPGTYPECFQIAEDENRITIQGLGGVTIVPPELDSTLGANGLINIYEADVKLWNLTIEGGYPDGIEAVHSDLQLINVVVRDALRNGLSLRRANVDATDCLFENNGDDGVAAVNCYALSFLRTEANDNGPDVMGPELSTNASDGFDLRADEISMTTCGASGNYRRGLSASRFYSLDVEIGVFSENGTDGIHLEDFAYARIFGAVARENGRRGLGVLGYLNGKECLSCPGKKKNEGPILDIVSGSYSDNGRRGIDVSAVEYVLVDTATANYNGLSGVRIGADAPVHEAALSYVSASHNRRNGIRVGPGDEGPYATGGMGGDGCGEWVGRLTVTNPFAYGNRRDGVHVREVEEVAVSGGFLIFNRDDGLEVRRSCEVDVDGVLAFGNEDRQIDIEDDPWLDSAGE